MRPFRWEYHLLFYASLALIAVGVWVIANAVYRRYDFFTAVGPENVTSFFFNDLRERMQNVFEGLIVILIGGAILWALRISRKSRR